MRSSWKGQYQPLKLMRKFLVLGNIMSNLKIYTRAFFISAFLSGREVNVYNGKKFVVVSPTNLFIKHRLGEFARTRAFFVPKAKKKSKTKAKKKSKNVSMAKVRRKKK